MESWRIEPVRDFKAETRRMPIRVVAFLRAPSLSPHHNNARPQSLRRPQQRAHRRTHRAHHARRRNGDPAVVRHVPIPAHALSQPPRRSTPGPARRPCRPCRPRAAQDSRPEATGESRSGQRESPPPIDASRPPPRAGVDVTGGRAARRRRIVHTASRASRAAEAPRGRVGWAGAAAPSETLSPSTLTHHSHRSLVHCGRVSPSPRTRRPTTSSMSPYANSRRRALPRARARHSRLTAPSPQSAKP